MLIMNAYAKVNMGLDVIRKREDGYHEVRMIMQTIGIHDTLEFEKTNGIIEITCSQAKLACDKTNLIYRAARLMLDTYGIEGGIRIHLTKRIPIAAGLAGGSTDAAATMRGIREIYGLQVTDEELMTLGVKIGADVPYCIKGGTMLAEGIGEILSSLPEIPKAYLVIAKPQIDVSTAFVYGNLKLPDQLKHPDIDEQIKALQEHDLMRLTKAMGNVLEYVTSAYHPVIGELEMMMRENGALQAMMSGSGPTVFGVFDSEIKAQAAYQMINSRKLTPEIYRSEFVNHIQEITASGTGGL